MCSRIYIFFSLIVLSFFLRHLWSRRCDGFLLFSSWGNVAFFLIFKFYHILFFLKNIRVLKNVFIIISNIILFWNWWGGWTAIFLSRRMAALTVSAALREKSPFYKPPEQMYLFNFVCVLLFFFLAPLLAPYVRIGAINLKKKLPFHLTPKNLLGFSPLCVG